MTLQKQPLTSTSTFLHDTLPDLRYPPGESKLLLPLRRHAPGESKYYPPLSLATEQQPLPRCARGVVEMEETGRGGRDRNGGRGGQGQPEAEEPEANITDSNKARCTKDHGGAHGRRPDTH